VFSPSSRGRLTARDLERFPGDNLFHRIGRATCRARCLPRKELYEAWEMARRVRRRFRGGRIVDLGAGHGLLAQVLLLLDDSSPNAAIVDTGLPASATMLHEALLQEWPRLAGRVAFASASIDDFPIRPDDLVVSSHACGALTDLVLDRAVAARARVAVLPCCHNLAAAQVNGADKFAAWADRALAIDIARAAKLQQRGYEIWTQAIPAEITPKNRLLLGGPTPAPDPSR
jgi:SAM-dependent methyltransferase